MSEAPKPRTSGDIQNENAHLTYKAGQVQYVIRQNQKDLDMINDRLRDLALEYVQVKAKEDEVSKLVAEAKAKDEAEKKAKENAEKAAQIPTSVDQQASTQPGSEAPKLSPVGPVGQG